ncbi:hypothetical protein TWF696_004618 [Orbilia brochopaga]|uniref:F-box domain-containing protein n=1 Tax=Orbilia brochopaga TaxID=3140254 RepID=A0AAV9V7V7_9PEZI
MRNITSLPTELLIKIFSRLSFQDHVGLSLTCLLFRSILDTFLDESEHYSLMSVYPPLNRCQNFYRPSDFRSSSSFRLPGEIVYVVAGYKLPNYCWWKGTDIAPVYVHRFIPDEAPFLLYPCDSDGVEFFAIVDINSRKNRGRITEYRLNTACEELGLAPFNEPISRRDASRSVDISHWPVLDEPVLKRHPDWIKKAAGASTDSNFGIMNPEKLNVSIGVSVQPGQDVEYGWYFSSISKGTGYHGKFLRPPPYKYPTIIITAERTTLRQMVNEAWKAVRKRLPVSYRDGATKYKLAITWASGFTDQSLDLWFKVDRIMADGSSAPRIIKRDPRWQETVRSGDLSRSGRQVQTFTHAF